MSVCCVHSSFTDHLMCVCLLTFSVARWCLFYRRPSFLGFELGESVAFVHGDITGQKGRAA